MNSSLQEQTPGKERNGAVAGNGCWAPNFEKSIVKCGQVIQIVINNDITRQGCGSRNKRRHEEPLTDGKVLSF